MRGSPLRLFALALAAALPSQAFAAPFEGEWRAIVAPDDVAKVSVPCAEAATRPDGFVGEDFAELCVERGLGFGLVVGDGPSNDDFDTTLANARKDMSAPVIALTTVGGYRAFTAASRPGQSLIRVVVVDYAPGKLVIAIAIEDREGAIAETERAAALAAATRFIGSLEVTAK